jgi:hypothetical protein
VMAIGSPRFWGVLQVSGDRRVLVYKHSFLLPQLSHLNRKNILPFAFYLFLDGLFSKFTNLQRLTG